MTFNFLARKCISLKSEMMEVDQVLDTQVPPV